VGVGRHRTVFRDGDVVYKVPHDETGYGALSNSLEAAPITVEDPDHYALCEIVSIQDFPVLMMEYVEHCGWSEEKDWTWGIDCGQIGHTKDGRLVAYDWGY